jgi:hypothetical protein
MSFRVGVNQIMAMQAYLYLVVPFIILFYLAFLLFIRPPRVVLLASLAGGLTIAIINALADLLAYYLHWWHFTINELTFHLPLPFYITPFLIYGGIVYLLIWRWWHGRWHWLALVFLIGTPLFGFVRDLFGSGIAHTTYLTWDSVLAGPMDFLLWLVMFYAGYLVFRRLAPGREVAVVAK